MLGIPEGGRLGSGDAVRGASLLLLLVVLAPLPTCKAQSREAPPALFSTWVHAHEEDTERFQVYRPKGQRLPRSRGRQGFAIEPDGRFEVHRIARGDGIERVPGRWQLDFDGPVLIVRVFLKGSEEEALSLRIESVTPEKLVVRR